MNVFPFLLCGLSFLFSQINESEGMKCDIEAAINYHKNFREESHQKYRDKADQYKPSLGCGLCTTDICIPNESAKSEDSDCKQMSGLQEFEWETDIFEFGLLGSFFPKKGYVKVTMNDDYYLWIEIEVEVENEINITVALKFCSLKEGKNKPKCAPRYSVYSFLNFTQEDCLYLALGFLENNKIHFFGKEPCHFLASAGFYVKTKIKNELPDFEFNIKDPIKVSIHFEIDPGYPHEGVPIMLPCSQGGYAFDTDTTRFLEGEKCWQVYYGSSPINGLPYIIEHFYNNNEDIYFEKSDDREKYVPAYTDGTTMTLKKTAMFPKKKKNEALIGKKRETCEYVLPNITDEEIKNMTEKENEPVNLENIEALFGTGKDTDGLGDLNFFEDAQIQDQLNGLDGFNGGLNLKEIKLKNKTTTTKKPTTTGSGGSGAITDVTIGATQCFKSEVINAILTLVLFIQLFI